MRDSTSRLRLALDGTPLLGVRTGIGQTVASLVDALAEADRVDLVVYAITLRGGGSPAAMLPSGARAAARAIPARAVRACWEHADLPRVESWTGPVDVVHGTNFVGPPARCPVLVSVHDLTFLTNPALSAPTNKAT